MSNLSSFINGFVKGFRKFGEKIAHGVNSVALTIVYFLGVGPVAVLTKLSGEKHLELSVDPNVHTYWKELNLSTKPKEYYYRMF